MKYKKHIANIMSSAIFLLFAACTETEFVPEPYSPVFPLDVNGNVIPIADLSIKTVSGKTIRAGIDGMAQAYNGVDTARFIGVEYSEDITEVMFVLPEGATIEPQPPTVKDSIEINVPFTSSKKLKRKYWTEKSEPYTITTADGEKYLVSFKLENFKRDKKNNLIDTDMEPSENEKGTIFIDRFNNFDDPIPNQNYWKRETGSGSTWNLYMQNVDGYECIKVENGELRLIAKYDGTVATDADKGPYKTGGIRTKIGFPINTRVEVRAYMTRKVQGGFPAIWQMPWSENPGTLPGWPAGGEVDIMEWVNSTPDLIYQTLHLGPAGPDHSIPMATPECDVTQYHVYAAERRSDGIETFIDGQSISFKSKQEIVNNSNGLNRYSFEDFYFDIILNMSLGRARSQNNWPGIPDMNDLKNNGPMELVIDWVRVMEIPTSESKQY